MECEPLYCYSDSPSLKGISIDDGTAVCSPDARLACASIRLGPSNDFGLLRVMGSKSYFGIDHLRNGLNFAQHATSGSGIHHQRLRIPGERTCPGELASRSSGRIHGFFCRVHPRNNPPERQCDPRSYGPGSTGGPTIGVPEQKVEHLR